MSSYPAEDPSLLKFFPPCSLPPNLQGFPKLMLADLCVVLHRSIDFPIFGVCVCVLGLGRWAWGLKGRGLFLLVSAYGAPMEGRERFSISYLLPFTGVCEDLQREGGTLPGGEGAFTPRVAKHDAPSAACV